jgi:molecular chaperone GrpE
MTKKTTKKDDKDLKETLQRLQAEFENYKKRTEKEKEEFSKYANEKLIKNILPIIDNFEIALKNCKNKDEFYKGIELVYANLIDTLQKLGLKPIKTEDEKFDPYRHEALLAEKSDKPENTIIGELQAGYMLNDKVIRHAKVKVSKK